MFDSSNATASSAGMMRSHRSLTRTLLLTAILGAGCSRDQRPGASTVVDSAGVRIVTSVAPAWDESAFQIDPLPLVRVGSDDPGPTQFSLVFLGLLLDDGGIVVAEASVNEIRVFNADGTHRMTLGRRGGGPGEFQAIDGLFRYLDDSLIAYDPVERRATYFALAGGSPRVVDNRDGGRRAAFGGLADGRVLLYDPGSAMRRDLSPGLQWVNSPVDVLDSAGAVTTIQQLPSRLQHVEPDGNTRPLVPSHSAVHAATTDGFYWATSDRYEIRFFDAGGALRRILSRPVEPVRVTREMYDSYVEAFIAEQRRFEGPRAERYREVYAATQPLEDVPLYSRAFVDGEGRLWLGQSRWPASDVITRTWSLFSPEGAWLADLEAPSGFQVLDSRGGLVLGVSQEDGEAPYVQIHRLIVPR